MFDSSTPSHTGIAQLAERLSLKQQVPRSIRGPGAKVFTRVSSKGLGRRSTKPEIEVQFLVPAPRFGLVGEWSPRSPVTGKIAGSNPVEPAKKFMGS